jgi:archaellum biogenesis ATPase FlaH
MPSIQRQTVVRVSNPPLRPHPQPLDVGPQTGYSGAAAGYWDAGWEPVPLGDDKQPRFTGCTGHTGTVNEGKIGDWIREHDLRKSNIGIRVNGVLGIDVDAHDGKVGAESLRELFQQFGGLPKTYYSTARHGTQSRIRLFRLPAGYERTKFRDDTDDIDMIQWFHRTVQCWPSIHPKIKEMYRWYTPEGQLMPEGQIPQLEDIPFLPMKWVVGMEKPKPQNNEIDLSNATWDQTKAEPTLRKLLGREIQRLKDLRTGGQWDNTVWAVACVLARMVRTKPLGFSDEDARTVLRSYAPTDDGFTMEMVLSKFDAAIPHTAGLLWGDELLGLKTKTSAQILERDEDDEEVEPTKLKVLRRNDLRDRKPPEWWVGGLIQEGTIALVAGDPGVGKSFLMIDMAARLTLGMSFFGRPCRKAKVLYVPAEGVNSFNKRMDAWEQHHERTIPDEDLFFIEEGIDLTDEAANERLIATIVDEELLPDIIILDTFSQLAPVDDENSNAAVAAVMRSVKAIQRVRPKSTIILVHHLTKAINGRVRGASALRGNVDTVLAVRAKDGGFFVSTEIEHDGKQKDGPGEKLEGFVLESIVLPDNQTSAVVERYYSDKDEMWIRVEGLMEPGEQYTMKQLCIMLEEPDDDAGRKRMRRRLDPWVKAGKLTELGESTRDRRWMRVE